MKIQLKKTKSNKYNYLIFTKSKKNYNLGNFNKLNFLYKINWYNLILLLKQGFKISKKFNCRILQILNGEMVEWFITSNLKLEYIYIRGFKSHFLF